MYVLVRQILKAERILEEWKYTIIVPIYKIGDRCKNQRGITLGNTAYKILVNIIWKKLNHIGKITWDIQNGFGDGSSVIDNIFVLKIINKKIWEYSQIVQYLFIIFKRHVTLYIETHYGNVWKNLKYLKN